MIRDKLRVPVWIIISSFIFALVLTAMPLPVWAQSWRPDWLAMVLIYWCMAMPARVSVGVGWMTGLSLDVLQGALLGQHALGLAIIAFFVSSFHQRMRVYPLVQQALVVAALLLVYRMLMLWIFALKGAMHDDALFWLPSLSSMLLWPWLFIIMRDIRRKTQVS